MKILLASVISVFFACNQKKVFREVARTEKIDQDIILINIGNSTRTEIAALILDIEKCKPLIVGIDVLFLKNRQSLEDSILANAIEKVSNDILAYRFDSTGKEERSLEKFRKFVNNEGYVNLDLINGVSSHFTPLKEVGGKLYESFALRIIKQWKPDFKHNLGVNESIPILFQRSQQQYYYFVKEDLLDKNVCELLENKIVLVGFLGPGDEDKQFTPIRSNDKELEGNPDTYGLVIQANAIRTILEYEKKN
jgi:CHASE2 domain-containing sensor protein